MMICLVAVVLLMFFLKGKVNALCVHTSFYRKIRNLSQINCPIIVNDPVNKEKFMFMESCDEIYGDISRLCKIRKLSLLILSFFIFINHKNDI